MATTTKDGPPAKERSDRSSLSPSTKKNPRARPTRSLSPASSEKNSVIPSTGKKSTPNYLKPTFSSCPDTTKVSKVTTIASAPGTTRSSSQKSLTAKKGQDAAKTQPQRSASFNSSRAQKPALSSRPSFSERTTTKGKPPSLSRIKVDKSTGRKPSSVGGGPRSKCSSTTSSANVSTASSPKAPTEETMSNEDREAALDILDLEMEEHVLMDIPPAVVDNKAAPLPVGEENNAVGESSDICEQSLQGYESEQGEEAGKTESKDASAEEDHQELSTTEEIAEGVADQKPEETEENADVEAPAAESDGETAVANVEGDNGGDKELGDEANGGGEEVKLQISEGLEGKETTQTKENRKEEATPMPQGKKELPPAYNDVIKKTASKLAGQRNSKVKALVGAFETVMVMDSGGQAPGDAPKLP